MDYGNTKTPSMYRRLGSATLSQLAFCGESNPNFPWDKFHWDNTVVERKKKAEAVGICSRTEKDCRLHPTDRTEDLNRAWEGKRASQDFVPSCKAATVWSDCRAGLGHTHSFANCNKWREQSETNQLTTTLARGHHLCCALLDIMVVFPRGWVN